MREIKEDIRRQKDLLCSWIGRNNIVKMALVPKAVYMFNTVPIKNPMTFRAEIEKLITKCIWKQKKNSNSQTNFEQKVHCWRHHNTRLPTTIEP
jgi:hypothetical protein